MDGGVEENSEMEDQEPIGMGARSRSLNSLESNKWPALASSVCARASGIAGRPRLISDKSQ